MSFLANPDFGLRLCQAMHWRGFSPKSLADELGISFTVILSYMCDTSRPNETEAQALAQALDISCWWLTYDFDFRPPAS